MTSLGLIDRKPTTSKAIQKGEKYIDPEADILTPSTEAAAIDEPNPLVSLAAVYNEITKIYTQLQNDYKFIFTDQKTDKRTRLHIGCKVEIVGNIIVSSWRFYNVIKSLALDVATIKSLCADQPVRKELYASVDQNLYPFYVFHPDVDDEDLTSSNIDQKDEKRTSIKSCKGDKAIDQLILRTEKDDDLINSLIDLAAKNNVQFIPFTDEDKLVNNTDDDSISTDPLESARREILDKKRKEEEAKESERLKEAAEEARASSRPLPFIDPLPYNQQNFLDSGYIILGAGEDELQKRSDDWNNDDETITSATEVGKTNVPSDEELNKIGADIYKRDNVHGQVLSQIKQINEFFAPLVSVSSPDSYSGKSTTNLKQTIYVPTDARTLYENYYYKIGVLKQVAIKIFPLLHFKEPEGRTSSHQLWITHPLNCQPIQIDFPERFFFLVNFAEDSNGVTLHKIVTIWDERERSQSKLKSIDKLLQQEFENNKKLIDSNRKRTSTPSVGKTTPPVIGKTTPPQTSTTNTSTGTSTTNTTNTIGATSNPPAKVSAPTKTVPAKKDDGHLF